MRETLHNEIVPVAIDDETRQEVGLRIDTPAELRIHTEAGTEVIRFLKTFAEERLVDLSFSSCEEPKCDLRLRTVKRLAKGSIVFVQDGGNSPSGHIFNFVLGGVAVCLGLSAFMAPHLKFEFAAAELFITIGIILNAHIGTRNEWHRRWLDYRQLAERLRPMRSLKLLGIAAPDAPGTPTNPVPRRWLDWYASGIWRAMGCVAGSLDGQRAERLARVIGEYEIAPQVAYHHRSSLQINELDHRLGVIGFMLFIATLVVSVATLVGMTLNASWVTNYGNWFTLVSAGFPALGTAIFGIRFQGDFGGDAVRSQSAANALRVIDAQLQRGVPLTRAADLVEQAARVMLEHLDEWRLINQQRDLSVG